MNCKIILLLLFVSIESFGQNETKVDSVLRNSSPYVKVVIRGSTSYQEPLYVVDGNPVSSEEVKNIKPETIESINVLKDSAIVGAMFCNRPRNNVVIITTKKLSKRELRKMKKKSQ